MIQPAELSGTVSSIIRDEAIRHGEWINDVLLSLSNDMVKVRNRQDLLKVITDGLKKLIPLSYSMITVLDETGNSYRPYIIGEELLSGGSLGDNNALTLPGPVEDGINNVAALYYKPLVFDMRSFDLDKTPQWFQWHYAAGAREMVVKMLPGNGASQYSLMLFAGKVNTFNSEALQIIQRVSSQLSTAASNISANEEILEREKQQSFLLEFSHDIAAVRSKADLGAAITRVLQKVLHKKLSMIRIIEDDGLTLSPYLYDSDVRYKDEAIFKELAAKNIDINEALSARVLNGEDPVVFNVEEERRQGNNSPYIHFWTIVGMKQVYGAPLRVGNTNIGTLWLLTDEINLPLLKGICAQISIAIFNIRANEKLLAYKQQLEVENHYLQEQIKTIYNFSDIIGSGAAMQKVYHLITMVAASNSTVLLLGETGTGKELIARALHNASPRKNKLMIKVNCAALPANLIESELFGHERGAFTGAIDRRIGKFEMAQNSTLFLDEIGEMTPELQVKLLRVLQEKEVERVGGRTTIKVDVRIIAATNRDLEEEVRAGRFRADLFYRLNVFPIHLPPLRERQEDIEPLAHFFVNRFSRNIGKKVTGIAPKVLQELKSYLWPGNVREMEHLIERSILLSTGELLKDIQLPGRHPEDSKLSLHAAAGTLQDMERAYIIEVLKRCSGKISGTGGAAEILEIPGTTLHSKMKKLAISKADYFPK